MTVSLNKAVKKININKKEQKINFIKWVKAYACTCN